MPQIKNLKKAVKKIKQAVKNQETVVLFADADLDGITSALILEEALQTMGLKIKKAYFPDRDKEGYSLNETALGKLKEFAPGLLILLDCGISNHQELKIAQDMGFAILVLDHHEVAEEIPKTGIIVDVKQKKDSYPFKGLSTSSLTYLLSQELLGKKMSLKNSESLKELAGLGVIADMMEIKEINQEIVASAHKTIFTSFRVGFQALEKIIPLKEETPREFFSQMVAVLNITEIKDNLPLCYLLLKSTDYEKAINLARDLWLESEKRKQEIKEMSELVLVNDNENPKKIIFEGFSNIQQAITGAIASRVCNKTQKPTFIYKLNHELTRGSVRTPHGVDAVLALRACSNYLLMYGGHKPAAGFSLKNENLEDFKKCLESYFKA